MRLDPAPKVAVVEGDTAVAEEDKVVAEVDKAETEVDKVDTVVVEMDLTDRLQASAVTAVRLDRATVRPGEVLGIEVDLKPFRGCACCYRQSAKHRKY